MEQPIEVFKHKISKTPRMGVGQKHILKNNIVFTCNQRVTRNSSINYTHIE